MIVLLDENDNSPVFVNGNKREVTISEDAEIGATVVKADARDKDSAFPIAYVSVSCLLRYLLHV